MSNQKSRPGSRWGKRKILILYISIAALTLLLNLLAWCSRTFCDTYIAYIFPIWVNTYGRFTGLFPFSVGEWLIVAGILLVLMAAVLGVGCGVKCLLGMAGVLRRDSWRDSVFCDAIDGVTPDRKIYISGWIRRFYKFFAWVLLLVWLIMTLNCVILYHASTFSEKYFGEDTGDYTLEELFVLRNYVVEQCNSLSQRMEREEDDTVHYPGSILADGSDADMSDKAREAMKRLGETYPQLDGYYPRPKPLLSSDFMCQQYMQGYYFPFSLEANYNDVMYILNIPETLCHELAHLRGYIYEDEANFISYIACIQSDDIYFQYSGYLSILYYLENDVYRASQSNPELFAGTMEQIGLVELLPQVREDNIFVEQKEWDRINGKALISTETVDKVTDTLIDASLKIHGVSDGKISYSRVVTLMLQYYRTES